MKRRCQTIKKNTTIISLPSATGEETPQFHRIFKKDSDLIYFKYLKPYLKIIEITIPVIKILTNLK